MKLITTAVFFLIASGASPPMNNEELTRKSMNGVPMTAEEYEFLLASYKQSIDQAWKEAEPAKRLFKDYPESDDAKAAAEIAVKHAERVEASFTQASADLAVVSCHANIKDALSGVSFVIPAAEH